MILVKTFVPTMYCANPKDMRLRRTTIHFGRGPKPGYMDIPLFGGGLEENVQLSGRVRAYFPSSRMRDMGGRMVGDTFYSEVPDGD